MTSGENVGTRSSRSTFLVTAEGQVEWALYGHGSFLGHVFLGLLPGPAGSRVRQELRSVWRAWQGWWAAAPAQKLGGWHRATALGKPDCQEPWTCWVSSQHSAPGDEQL